MAVPVAPAAGEPIAEAWGDVVHDSIVAMDIQAGFVGVPLNNVISASVVVTFPRPFATTPIIVATQGSNSASTFATVGGQTATGFTAIITSRAGTAISLTHNCYWIAYGPRA